MRYFGNPSYVLSSHWCIRREHLPLEKLPPFLRGLVEAPSFHWERDDLPPLPSSATPDAFEELEPVRAIDMSTLRSMHVDGAHLSFIYQVPEVLFSENELGDIITDLKLDDANTHRIIFSEDQTLFGLFGHAIYRLFDGMAPLYLAPNDSRSCDLVAMRDGAIVGVAKGRRWHANEGLHLKAAFDAFQAFVMPKGVTP